MVHIGARGRRHLAVDLVAGKNLGEQVRTTETRAVHAVMDARVLPDGSEDAMLDVVQGQVLVRDHKYFAIPGTQAKQSAIDLANRLDRIVFEDQVDGGSD